ncbi:hypothetical protein FV395_23320 [Salmonella enterica]|nr:hypothetical protein [Salmonella enterica]
MAIYQQHNSPLAPATAPSADDLLNAYQQHTAALRGEVQTEAAPTTNPFKSDALSQQDEQKQHISNVEQYLSPIAINRYDAGTDHTEEKFSKWAAQMDNDPAYKEFYEPMQAYLDQQLALKEQGVISYDDALSNFTDYAEREIAPIIHKHHGPHSESHKTTFHDDMPQELPELVKKARGVK